jgi:hypothetical protein
MANLHIKDNPAVCFSRVTATEVGEVTWAREEIACNTAK